MRTPNRLRALIVTSVAAAIMSPIAAFPQSPTDEALKSTGFREDRNYFSPEPFEHYDSVSGNVLLTFTDLTLPGNAGRSLQFQRVFNHQRWSATQPTQTSRWSFGFPGIVMRILERSLPQAGAQFNDNVASLTAWSPKFVMADGGIHPTIFSMRPDTSNNGSIDTSTRMVISAQFYKYDRVDHILYMPDGTTCHYIPDGVDPSTGRPWFSLDWFEDPFGNRVTLTRQGMLLTVTQDLRNGEARQVNLTLDEGGRIQSMNYEGQIWDYGYVGTAAFSDIETVTLPSPDGPGTPRPTWTFSYQPSSSYQDPTGTDMTRITTPNGGRIEYTWADRDIILNGPNNQPYTYRLHFLQYRDSYDRDNTQIGHWVLDWAGSGTSTTTITTPSGTVASFSHGLQITSQSARLLTGGFGVVGRKIGTVTATLEEEALTYEVVPVVRYDASVWFGTAALLQRTVTRGPRTYVTQYEYDKRVDYDWFFPWNRHQPTRIFENNNEGLGRTTLGGHPKPAINRHLKTGN